MDDQIEIVRGNIVGGVDVTQSSGTTVSKLSELTDKLSAPDASSLLPAGTTAQDLIGDSLLCRLQELGGSIMDLIEDGFGLNNILDGFKMPELSDLGDKLKELNPVNLLDKLGDLSLDSITEKVGELIQDAVGFIGDIVQDTFEQVERAIKSIPDMFDEFGDRINDMGKYIEDTITGIVGGVGDVLQDLTKPIEDIINTLTTPCPETNPSAQATATNLLNSEKQMFDTDIELVHGNIVSVNSIAQTSGQASAAVRQAAAAAVPVSFPLSGDPGSVAKNSNGVGLSDAVEANASENAAHEQIKQHAQQDATQNVTKTMVDQAVKQKKNQDKDDVKVVDTNESGENQSVDTGFKSDDVCDNLINKSTHLIRSAINHLYYTLHGLSDFEGTKSTTRVGYGLFEQVQNYVVVHDSNDMTHIGYLQKSHDVAKKYYELIVNNEEEKRKNTWNNIVSSIRLLPYKNVDLLQQGVNDLMEYDDVYKQLLDCENFNFEAPDVMEHQSQSEKTIKYVSGAPTPGDYASVDFYTMEPPAELDTDALKVKIGGKEVFSTVQMNKNYDGSDTIRQFNDAATKLNSIQQ